VEITRSAIAGDGRALTSSISINKLSYVVVKTLLVVLMGDQSDRLIPARVCGGHLQVGFLD
jgi:hypothetical protein